MLRQAAAKPGCSFDRDYGRPSIMMMLPELSPMRDAARLLALEALARASDKDYRGSIDDINAMMRMAEHRGTDPIFVSGLVAISIEGLAIDTLEHVLASGRLAPETWRQSGFRRSLYRAMLKRDFHMEEAFAWPTFDDIARGAYGIWDDRQPLWPRRSNAHPQVLVVLRRFTGSSCWPTISRPRPSSATCSIRRPGCPTARPRNRRSSSTRMCEAAPGGILTGLLMPALSNMIRSRGPGGGPSQRRPRGSGPLHLSCPQRPVS